MFSEMFTQALDFMAQKNVGVYYPKDLREKDLMEEKDASDFVDINEISDEDFKKAVGVKEEVNG